MSSSSSIPTVSLRVYVVGVSQFADRCQSTVHLTDLLSKVCNVERVTWCNEHDPDEVSASVASGASDLADFTPVPEGQTPAAAFFNAHIRQLHVNQISNAKKHVHALTRISEFTEDGKDVPGMIHLIIEDDCTIFSETPQPSPADQKQALRKLVNSAKALHAKAKWGVLMPCLSVSVPPEVHARQDDAVKQHDMVCLNDSMTTATPLLSSTCNAYFVTPGFATAMLPWVRKVKFPWNVQLCYAMHMAMKVRVEMGLSPGLPDILATKRVVLLDGSKTGHFVATLSGSNPLTLCPEYVDLVRLLQSRDNKLTAKEFDDQVKATMSRYHERHGVVKHHPEIVRLYAQCLAFQGKRKEAHEELRRAYTVVSRTPLCIVNNQSPFMREFLQSFSWVQNREEGSESSPSPPE